MITDTFTQRGVPVVDWRVDLMRAPLLEVGTSVVVLASCALWETGFFMERFSSVFSCCVVSEALRAKPGQGSRGVYPLS